MYTKVTTVINSTGLHARPATEFVNMANHFSSTVTIRNIADDRSRVVNAKSIVLLLTLGLGQGTEVEIAADGEDEVEAVDTLIALVESGFDE